MPGLLYMGDMGCVDLSQIPELQVPTFTASTPTEVAPERRLPGPLSLPSTFVS